MNSSAEEVLALLAEGRLIPGYAAAELDKGQPYVSRLLGELVDEGYATKLHRGLYEITPEGERFLREEVSAEGDPREEEANDRDPPEQTTPDGGPDMVESNQLEISVAGLDLEGHGTTLENRKRAIVAIVERLREEGAVDAGELKAILDEYDHGYGDADAAWSNFRRQDVFAELPVETPGQGGRKYRYTG